MVMLVAQVNSEDGGKNASPRRVVIFSSSD